MRVEKEPVKKRSNNRGRTTSIARDLGYYDLEHEEDVHAPNFIELKNNIRANSFAAGVTRIPLLTEIMKVTANIIDMRWKEIHFIREATEMMKTENIDNILIKDFELGLRILEWEMDEKNVLKGDLPSLGPETTNFVDISAWLIFYFELLHENMHRITDLIYALSMLNKANRKKLRQWEDKAGEVMKDFEQNVKSFNLVGESAAAYKRVVTEIRKNCQVCL
uniref:Uncharacterized protein n=1 Tax=Panagrolaimus sp. ES5 TaxID=591445 RepID=A0AC34FMG5_9BILA